MTDPYQQRRQAVRLRALYRSGLSAFQNALRTLDEVKRILSPQTAAELAALREPATLDAALRRLRHADLSIQLALKNWRWSRGPKTLVLTLPSIDLVDYFLQVDANADADDPLGARSLLGILRHYDIEQVEITANGYHSSRASTISLDERYQRHFRLADTPQALLRRSIDLALWERRRVLLSPTLVESYRKINPQRRAYLTAQGLRLIPCGESGECELVMADGPGEGSVDSIPPETASAAPPTSTPLADASTAERPSRTAPVAIAEAMTALRDDERVPRGLLFFIEGALLNSKPQFIPNTLEYCRFLSRDDAPALLARCGVAVNLPPQRRDGSFERPASIYPTEEAHR